MGFGKEQDQNILYGKEIKHLFKKIKCLSQEFLATLSHVTLQNFTVVFSKHTAWVLFTR